MLFKEVHVGPIGPSELSVPSSTWEDWIFAESQRRYFCVFYHYLVRFLISLFRLANLWFLIGCVICVKTGIPCDPSQTFRFLSLPSLKSLWEAPTQSAWEVEYEASHDLQMSGLVTVGDLIDVQKSVYSPRNAQKLDTWNAGIDNLGSLLNLVSGIV
jgi:hypothetical protein